MPAVWRSATKQRRQEAADQHEKSQVKGHEAVHTEVLNTQAWQTKAQLTAAVLHSRCLQYRG